MIFYYNKKPYDISKVTYRQFGFSEKIYDRPISLFKLVIEFEKFRNCIKKHFDSFVQETREDDVKTDYTNAIEELVSYDYPEFDQLVNMDMAILCEIVKRYLFFELLDACFDKNNPENCLIAVNSIDSIESIDGNIVLLGESYAIK